MDTRKYTRNQEAPMILVFKLPCAALDIPQLCFSLAGIALDCALANRHMAISS